MEIGIGLAAFRIVGNGGGAAEGWVITHILIDVLD
jgi:hypothetical protein